jgi:meso-butanediol dehydrogenase / (S,S)-butanediol dehydrogenase / diacetyl reductase
VSGAGPSRVMIVTGAGSGIGAAVAARAAGEGWRVTVCGRRPGPLAQVAARTGARPVTADVTDPAAVQALVDGTVAADGRLDCVVANAGVMRSGTVADLDPADWELSLRTNLTSAYLLARAALPHLLAGAGPAGEEGGRGGRPAAPGRPAVPAAAGGSMVAVSSIAALRASSAAAAYAVSKAGLVMLMQSLAADFGPAGLRANVVCPGWVRTEMADQEMTEFGAPLGLDRESAYREVTRLVPQRRPAEPAEIAAAVTWLAGPDASYVNGACLVVDGGTVLVDPGTAGLDFSISARRPPG